MKQSPLRESKAWWERWSQLHEFRSENGASLRRITPSTQVGRLSESHSDIGFQLLNSQVERRRESRKANGSSTCRCFNKMVFSLDCGKRTAATRLQVSGGKRFRGGIVEPPWKQTREIGTARAKVQNSRRYARLIRSGFTANCKRLRWQETCNGTPAPCDLKVEKKQKLLVTEVDTHTHESTHM